MAVNLDKEAYYRRIKRLYSNWKVKNAGLGVRVTARRSAVANFNVEKVSLWRIPEAKLAAVFRRAELALLSA